jgi:negative regulator of flagellin synthesis FlgM
VSYTNGIGNQQQFPGAAEAAAASSANRTTRAELTPASASSLHSQTAPMDEANLSTTASVVGQALSGSDVRFDKVAALQQSIAAGAYNVPASDVAQKVISALLH